MTFYKKYVDKAQFLCINSPKMGIHVIIDKARFYPVNLTK